MESPHSKSVQGPWKRGGAFPQLRHQELKEQAVAFYSEHKVQDALEGLLNEMFLIKPRDVYGYMVSVRTAPDNLLLVGSAAVNNYIASLMMGRISHLNYSMPFISVCRTFFSYIVPRR